MIRFSIIVPVYNVENYITKCIDSILSQDFNSYEVILINDGSTDKSGLICEQYELSNDKIRVFHKENGGLSDARNYGMAKAKGEYIIFIDSDDYIEAESLKKFDKHLENCGNPDVMMTLIKEVYEDSEPKYRDKDIPTALTKKGNKEDVVNWMFRYSNNLWPAQRYIVKHSLIEDNNLCFAVGYLHEDVDWTSKVFLFANTFTLIDYYWYNHRMGRKGSITTGKKPKRTLDVIDLVSKNIKYANYNHIDAKLRDVMFQRMLKSVFSSLSNYRFYDVQAKKNVIEALENNKDIFKYTVEFRHKVFVMLSKVFGFRTGLTLMSLMHNV